MNRTVTTITFPDRWTTMNLIEMLQAAGIDGNKADFYLASLEPGEATVASIAQKASIGRTNAYEVLDRLLADGLVATVQKGARVLGMTPQKLNPALRPA